MSCACTNEYLSHPIKRKKHLLIDHLLEVAKTSKKLFSQTNFSNKYLAYYSGLLHDLGKLNPIYQMAFAEPSKNVTEKFCELSKDYVQRHSRFSAWAANKLLEDIGCSDDTIDKIMILICGHHSSLRGRLGDSPSDEKWKSSQTGINSELSRFRTKTSTFNEFSKLNWDSCINDFSFPMDFDVLLKSKNSPHDYLEMSCAFSCLLQADRGSFDHWEIPKFNLELNTNQLIKNSPLGKIRSEFQNHVTKMFDDSQGVLIINAPTGIGKTKIFLDIISKYSKDENVQRVFYFSPLLALMDDFEEKIRIVISEEQHKDILIYNHLYSITLQDKKLYDTPGKYSPRVFENESFNKKFIVSTTQRLLMSIYSNKHRDKIKFASFRNSILIIDEVQTIPKIILSNLKKMFEGMNKYMNTKIIMVSATIPHEISNIKKIEMEKNIKSEYL